MKLCKQYPIRNNSTREGSDNSDKHQKKCIPHRQDCKPCTKGSNHLHTPLNCKMVHKYYYQSGDNILYHWRSACTWYRNLGPMKSSSGIHLRIEYIVESWYQGSSYLGIESSKSSWSNRNWPNSYSRCSCQQLNSRLYREGCTFGIKKGLKKIYIVHQDNSYCKYHDRDTYSRSSKKNWYTLGKKKGQYQCKLNTQQNISSIYCRSRFPSSPLDRSPSTLHQTGTEFGPPLINHRKYSL